MEAKKRRMHKAKWENKKHDKIKIWPTSEARPVKTECKTRWSTYHKTTKNEDQNGGQKTANAPSQTGKSKTRQNKNLA